MKMTRKEYKRSGQGEPAGDLKSDIALSIWRRYKTKVSKAKDEKSRARARHDAQSSIKMARVLLECVAIRNRRMQR